jgi:hypothetical protein
MHKAGNDAYLCSANYTRCSPFFCEQKKTPPHILGKLKEIGVYVRLGGLNMILGYRESAVGVYARKNLSAGKRWVDISVADPGKSRSDPQHWLTYRKCILNKTFFKAISAMREKNVRHLRKASLHLLYLLKPF